MKALFTPGGSVATVPLVFLAVTIVSTLQLPAFLLFRSDHPSVSVILNELVAIAGVPLLFIRLFALNSRNLIRLARPATATILIVALVTLGADVVIDYMTYASDHFFPIPDGMRETYEKLLSTGGAPSVLWKLVLLCLIPAICEEIFFRGFCQTSLAARWGSPAALIVTSLIFALLHGNPWHFHLYVILGLLMGWTYAATGSLWASIACHFINNAWTLFTHVAGFKLPIDAPFGIRDAGFAFAGIALCAAGAWLLQKRAPLAIQEREKASDADLT